MRLPTISPFPVFAETGGLMSYGTSALAAYRRMVALGMDTTNAPVVFDLENYNTADSGCVNAVKSFIQGWVEQMHVPPAQQAGVYGSTCASGLQRLAEISTPPDFVTGASWDGNRNTGAMPCVDSGLWTNHQRHKQYAGEHYETWNGVTLNIDSDCSNAPVYPGPDQLNTGQGCVGEGPGGWTSVRVQRPGPVVLEASFALERVRASAPRCTE